MKASGEEFHIWAEDRQGCASSETSLELPSQACTLSLESAYI